MLKNSLYTYLLIPVLLITVCSITSTTAQQNVLEKITQQFTVLKAFPPNENIMLITDMDFYTAGDIIWFSILNLNPVSDTCVSLSKVGYVEVLDSSNQPILQAKVALEHGRGKGSFFIPTDLKTGYYTLRGYTSWMKNFSPEFYFQKNLTIINVFKNESLIVDTIGEPLVKIFTEGGSFLANVKSNLVVKISNPAGALLKYKGWLSGNSNDSLLYFEPDNNGLSFLSFTPSGYQKYSAVFVFNDGTKITRALPDVMQHGTAFTIAEPAKDNLLVTVSSSNARDTFHLVVHDRNSIELAEKIILTNGIAKVLIDKNKLSNGLKNIVLFNKDARALNERLYVVKKALFDISAFSDKKAYLKRQPVILNFQINNLPQSAMRADVIISVHRIEKPEQLNDSSAIEAFAEDQVKNILSYNRYSYNNDVKQLNNMLITAKWKWFNWNDPSHLNPGDIKYLPEYEGHIISAKLLDKRTMIPVSNTVGYLSIPGKAFHFYSSRSDNNGSINFFTKELFGDNLVIAQGEQAQNNSTISILSPFSQEYASMHKSPFSISPKLSAQQVQRGINVQLQKNFAYNKIVTHTAPIKDSLPFFGKESIKYELDDYVRFPTMEEVLREYVRELNVKKKKNEFSLTMVTKDENGFAIVKKPAIFIDGVPAFDSGNKITHYDPLKIKTIKIVTDRYYYGPAIFEGIASFTTYKGNLEGYTPDLDATVIDYQGLQLGREFYSPVYETPAQKSSRIPDFRDVLFWSDDASISADGKGSVNFYTSDQTGTYKAKIKALAKDGRIAETTFTFDVVK